MKRYFEESGFGQVSITFFIFGLSQFIPRHPQPFLLVDDIFITRATHNQ
jgi:hypothetical protein